MKKLRLEILFLFIIFSHLLLAQSGVIKGRIFDEASNEPVPFANVVIMGTTIGSTSDLDGNFTITGVEPGFVKLQVSFVGYQTKVSRDISVSNAKTAYIEIGLNASSTSLNEVVVRVDPFQKRDEVPLSMQKIGVKEIESNPGSNRDISRVIQSFPGIGSTPAFRNDVIVRGGGPSENRFYLDDVEIPVLNHFATQGASGGPVGIINADFIGTVNYYSSAFPADRYNALSGVFEFTQIDGNPEKMKFRGTLGASEVSATIDGPIGENTTYIFSARRSYLQFLFSAIGLPFLPTFNDYQLKLKSKLNTKNELTVVSIGSLDNLTLNTGIKDPDPSQEYILTQIPVNNQWSYTLGFVLKHFMDNGYRTFVLSRNMLNNEFFKYPENDETRPKTFDYHSFEAENKGRYEVEYLLDNFKISYGVSGEYARYYNRTTQQFFNEGALQEINYKSNIDLFKYGFYGQFTKQITSIRTSVSLGLRADGNTFSKSMQNPLNQFSPRASVSFALTDKTRFSVSAGRFYELPAYTTLGYRNNNSELTNTEVKYIGVDHYVAGIEQKIGLEYLFSLEGFYKGYFQYPIDKFTGVSLANVGADYSSVAGAVPVESTGKGRAAGFEVLSRINKKAFNLIASYTFVRSLFTDAAGEEIPSSWDSRHLLTMTGTKTFNKNWSAGFKWRFVGGLPYTPYELEKSAIKEAWDANGQPYFDYSRLNELRFSPFHQLDIRVDKKYFYDKWSLMFYVDIQNVYNFKSEGQDYIIRERNADGSFMLVDNGTKYVLDRIPNTSGIILPTVGIMVEF
ncbi:TonB-dependent receptor domain-containing protein [Saccharicrinis sp. FJH62]|uniref:TonB-dependent receptor n=1 Tax=Saccharicrinis sp. FJH62 TaxID=3344657 RepID=UPI0035D45959